MRAKMNIDMKSVPSFWVTAIPNRSKGGVVVDKSKWESVKLRTKKITANPIRAMK
jgi:hypothetical protein